MRIACLQHVKRDFIDCGKEDKDAQEVVIIKVQYRVMHMLLTGNWSRMLILTL